MYNNSASNNADFESELASLSKLSDLMTVQHAMDTNGGRNLTGRHEAIMNRFNSWKVKWGGHYARYKKDLEQYGYRFEPTKNPVVTTVRKGKSFPLHCVPFDKVMSKLPTLLKKARTQDPKTYWKTTVLEDKDSVTALKSCGSKAMNELCEHWAHGRLRSDKYADVATVEANLGTGDASKIAWDRFEKFIMKYTLEALKAGQPPKDIANTLAGTTYKSINDGINEIGVMIFHRGARNMREFMKDEPTPSIASVFKMK
jgi:hypothetical protein